MGGQDLPGGVQDGEANDATLPQADDDAIVGHIGIIRGLGCPEADARGGDEEAGTRFRY